METLQEREERIRRLEGERASRRNAEVVWPIPDDPGAGVTPIEVAPGRGDLNYSSAFVPTFPTALAVVNRTVSFARIFQSQPWVAAAVMRMLTWAVRVPLRVYRDTGDKNGAQELKPTDHPLAAALAQPWDRGYTAQLVQAMLGPVLVNGNSVMTIDEGASGKIQFQAKDWRFTRPIMPFRDSIEGFTFDIDSPKFSQTYSVDKVLHIAWWSPLGPIGTSPLQQLGVTLNIEDAAQRHQIALFANGARPPSAILASDAFLGLDRAERQTIINNLRADITALYSGPENQGKPALLPPGLDWKPVGYTSVEAELVEQRKIAREEVAGVYLIAPPMLGIMEKANYSNMQAVREMTYTDCLGPPLVMCEQAINAQVIRDLLREDDLFCEFDFSGVLRGDRLQEIQALREAIGNALLTPNEGRDVLNKKRSDDPAMDQFYLPFNNLQPVGGQPQVGNVRETIQVPGTDPNSPVPIQAPPEDQAPQEGKRLHIIHRGREYAAV